MTPIGVRPFASDVSQGVRDWLEIHGSSELVLRNADRFARLRRDITIPRLTDGSFIA